MQMEDFIKDNGFVPLYVPDKDWKPIPTLGYYVNRNGQFIRIDYKDGFHYLKYVPDKDGYDRQNIATVDGGKMCRLSILVAYMFIDNPDPSKYKCVNHKNLNKQDNRAENLEWVTVQENTDHFMKNKEMSTPYLDYPLLQCLPQNDRQLLIVHEFETIKDVPTIGNDGRDQSRVYVRATCLGRKKSYHGYVWLYKKDRHEYEKQGYKFINKH